MTFVCVSMYACVCIYIYIYIYVYTYIYIYIYTYTCAHIYTCMYVYIYIYTHTPTHTHTHTHTYIHTYIQASRPYARVGVCCETACEHTGVCENTCFVCETWPCNLATETALQPWPCKLATELVLFRLIFARVSSSPEECFFTDTGFSSVGLHAALNVMDT